jgi:L-ribulose-5-phosphate 3-epimerase UlaE
MVDLPTKEQAMNTTQIPKAIGVTIVNIPMWEAIHELDKRFIVIELTPEQRQQLENAVEVDGVSISDVCFMKEDRL